MIWAFALMLIATPVVDVSSEQVCLLDRMSPRVRTQLLHEFRVAAGADPADPSIDPKITTAAMGDALAACAQRFHWNDKQIENASGWLTVGAMTPGLRDWAAANGLDFGAIERVAGRLSSADHGATAAGLPSEPDLSTAGRLSEAASAEGIAIASLDATRLAIFGSILGAIIQRDAALAL